MTLTGIKKHVGILEDARLVTTTKAGRVRTCSLGPRRLEDEQAWIATYQQMLEGRFASSSTVPTASTASRGAIAK